MRHVLLVTTVFAALSASQAWSSEGGEGVSVLGLSMAAIAVCDISNVVPTPAMKALHAHVIDTRVLDGMSESEYAHYLEGKKAFWKIQDEHGSLKACKWMALSFPENFIDIVP